MTRDDEAKTGEEEDLITFVPKSTNGYIFVEILAWHGAHAMAIAARRSQIIWRN